MFILFYDISFCVNLHVTSLLIRVLFVFPPFFCFNLIMSYVELHLRCIYDLYSSYSFRIPDTPEEPPFRLHLEITEPKNIQLHRRNSAMISWTGSQPKSSCIEPVKIEEDIKDQNKDEVEPEDHIYNVCELVKQMEDQADQCRTGQSDGSNHVDPTQIEKSDPKSN